MVFPAMVEPHRADEVPFDADRMRMCTVHILRDGPLLCCEGAPETVTPLCNRLLVDGEPRPFTPGSRQDPGRAGGDGGAGPACAGPRLSPAESGWKHESLEQDLVCAGLVALQDPPRPEVPNALRRCREAGVRVIMTTGDNPRTALAIARDVGLAHSADTRVITGDQLRGLSDIQLRVALDSPEVIFARVGANQKMRIVNALKQKDQVVAVTGDGVNDAPALKSADIGIAMGVGDRRGARGGRHGVTGRQLRQHRQRHRGGARGVREHPEVSHVHPGAQYVPNWSPISPFHWFRCRCRSHRCRCWRSTWAPIR